MIGNASVARNFIALAVASAICGCLPIQNTPKPGPDKQSAGTFLGAATGAGAGAVAAAQVSSSAGAGVFVGMGFGAIYGMLTGLGIDALEEDQLRREDERRRIEEVAWAQEVLAEHYQRRMELHPSRDIFPADLFFMGDNTKIRPDAHLLLREIAKLTKNRMPWSRIVVASYATTKGPDETYAKYLTETRAEALAQELVRGGIEPRRVQAQGIPMSEPLLVDPDDSPGRYRQAIEIIAVDR